MSKIVQFPLPKFARTVPSNGTAYAKKEDAAVWDRLRSRIHHFVEKRKNMEHWNERYRHLPRCVVAVIKPLSHSSADTLVMMRPAVKTG